MELLDIPRLKFHTSTDDRPLLFPADSDYSEMKVKRGTAMMRSGEPPSGIIYVRSGLIKAFCVSQEGREIAVAHVAAGEVCFMSILCLLANAPSPVEEVTMEDTEVWVLPKREFVRVQESSPLVQQFVAEVLLSKTRSLINRIEEMAFLPIRVRLERFLQRYHQSDNGTLFVSMTHDEIARSLGTSREVVSRLLLEMAAEGKVELRRGQILLLPFYNSGVIAAA